MKLLVCGRGRLVAEAVVYPEGIRLRLDDERSPEFWAEVYLTTAQLESLLTECRSAAQIEQPLDHSPHGGF